MKLKINIEGCAAVLYIIEGSRVRDNIESDSLMGVILWGFFCEKMHPYPDALRIMSGKSEGRCNSYGSKKLFFSEFLRS